MTDAEADVLRWLLVAQGLGADPTPWASSQTVGPDWPVHWANEPDLPDNVITLYDTDGQDDARNMRTGFMHTHPGVQVRVRAADEVAGKSKAEAIRDWFATGCRNNLVTHPVSGRQYQILNMAKIGRVHRLGKDVAATKRSLFTLNAVMAIRQLT